METLTLSDSDIGELAVHFGALTRKVPLHPISSVREYKVAVRALDVLLDAGAAEERHPLARLVAGLGEFIREYDEKNYRLPEVSPAQVLRTLMEEKGVRQSELPEVASQGVISEILAGKRQLNVRQIRALSRRFGVAPAVFIGSSSGKPR